MHTENPTTPSRGKRLGFVALLTALALAMTTGAATAADAPGDDTPATGEFTDVTEENVFIDDIAWMARNDVTRGCNPPSNDRYCPSEFVTRGQMAAFMHRLARSRSVDAGWLLGADWNDLLSGGIDGNAGNDGNDGTDGQDGNDGADGHDGLPFDASQFLAADGKAVDSDKLDGLDSTDFLQAADQAADSDTLDGKDSSEFLGTPTLRSDTMAMVAGVPNGHQVNCAMSEVPISGGFESSDPSIVLTENHPVARGWRVAGTLAVNGSITVYALCVPGG